MTQDRMAFDPEEARRDIEGMREDVKELERAIRRIEQITLVEIRQWWSGDSRLGFERYAFELLDTIREESRTKVASSDLHWMFSSILRVLRANNCFI